MRNISSTRSAPGTIRSAIPARVDRLRWTPFHTRMVVALGVAWILDGLEITIASSIAGDLTSKSTLGLSATAVGAIATVYLAGEVVGALGFGRLSDRLGRKKLFMVTLGVYLGGSALTALTAGNTTAWVAYMFLTRFIAGTGIGGEYAAINSAIDELIPARYRGRVDIAVNGTYWAGALIGTLLTSLLLHQLAPSLGWRLGFLLGPVLALVIIVIRRNLPESPRWLLMHGRAAEAEEAIRRIEQEARAAGQQLAPVDDSKAIEVKPTQRTSYLMLTYVLFRRYWRRSVLGATLMITQSFLYNAIFFTYTLVLTKFYHVSAASAPLYLILFAAGNLLGPLTIGRFFDTIGRKQMIAATYIGSGAMLAVTAALFDQHVLTATTQTIAWCVIFFFASAGASSAYLTVSEVFPLEVRAQAIAVFFAIAQCFGALGPVLYGHLIGNAAHTTNLFIGYLIGAGAMVLGGIVEIVLGIATERKSLEDIANPLSMVRRPVQSDSGLTSGSAGQVWRPGQTDWHSDWLPALSSLAAEPPRSAACGDRRRGLAGSAAPRAGAGMSSWACWSCGSLTRPRCCGPQTRDAQTEALAANGRRRRTQPGKVLFRGDRRCDYLVILAGKVASAAGHRQECAATVLGERPGPFRFPGGGQLSQLTGQTCSWLRSHATRARCCSCAPAECLRHLVTREPLRGDLVPPACLAPRSAPHPPAAGGRPRSRLRLVRHPRLPCVPVIDMTCQSRAGGPDPPARPAAL